MNVRNHFLFIVGSAVWITASWQVHGQTTSKFPLALHHDRFALNEVDSDRFALVVGNGNYEHMQILPNSINDAHSMAEALHHLGFRVLYKENASLQDFDDLADQLDSQASESDVVLFYYAGHALQVNGENFLVPVEAKLSVEGEVRYKTIHLGVILAHMEQTRSRVMIAILDSCRENPLPAEYRAAVAGAGLASVNASAGTLIEYATAPNKAAIDSIGGNHSPYTGALLNHLAQPDTEIEHVFKLVREDVVKLTNGAQVPWESSSITSDVFLNQAKVSNLVQGFWFNYNFPPVGRRVWSMTSPNTWIEQYDNGDQTQFNAISRTTIDGDNGVVVRRIDNEPFDPTVREGSAEVFIPDRQSKLMWTRFRSYESGQWSNWTYINEMKDVH